MKNRWLVVACVLAMVAPGVGVTWISTVSAGWALVLLAGVLSAVPFTIAAVRRQFNIFEPVYLFAASYLVLFALHPAAQLLISGGSPVFVGYVVGPTYAAALGIGAVGAISFYLGYYLPFGGNLGRRLPLPRDDWS